MGASSQVWEIVRNRCKLPILLNRYKPYERCPPRYHIGRVSAGELLMVDHTPAAAERLGLRDRAKDLIVQAVRPVLHSAEFDSAVRASVAEFLRGAEFTQLLRDALTSALPTETLARAAQSGVANAFQDPAVLSADFLSGGARVDKGTQILLVEKYRELVRSGAPLPSFADVGFRSFSQFDEDGILLFLFAVIGTTDRRAVEICSGVGYECNCANLVIHHGWDALMIDGSENNQKLARQFFTKRSDTQITVPNLLHAWIEPETIDSLITNNGYTGEIDLLTIDLDGVDYWIWKNITSINPRVVVTEYQPWFGPNEPYTVKNIKGYHYPDYAEKKMGYCGCSLSAHNKLAKEKGYRLIGCNRNQLNAFFLRNDIAAELFPEVSEESCLDQRRITEMTNWIRPMVDKQLAEGDWEKV